MMGKKLMEVYGMGGKTLENLKNTINEEKTEYAELHKYPLL